MSSPPSSPPVIEPSSDFPVDCSPSTSPLPSSTHASSTTESSKRRPSAPPPSEPESKRPKTPADRRASQESDPDLALPELSIQEPFDNPSRNSPSSVLQPTSITPQLSTSASSDPGGPQNTLHTFPLRTFAIPEADGVRISADGVITGETSAGARAPLFVIPWAPREEDTTRPPAAQFEPISAPHGGAVMRSLRGYSEVGYMRTFPPPEANGITRTLRNEENYAELRPTEEEDISTEEEEGEEEEEEAVSTEEEEEEEAESIEEETLTTEGEATSIDSDEPLFSQLGSPNIDTRLNAGARLAENSLGAAIDEAIRRRPQNEAIGMTPSGVPFVGNPFTGVMRVGEQDANEATDATTTLGDINTRINAGAPPLQPRIEAATQALQALRQRRLQNEISGLMVAFSTQWNRILQRGNTDTTRFTQQPRRAQQSQNAFTREAEQQPLSSTTRVATTTERGRSLHPGNPSLVQSTEDAREVRQPMRVQQRIRVQLREIVQQHFQNRQIVGSIQRPTAIERGQSLLRRNPRSMGCGEQPSLMEQIRLQLETATVIARARSPSQGHTNAAGFTEEPREMQQPRPAQQPRATVDPTLSAIIGPVMSRLFIASRQGLREHRAVMDMIAVVGREVLGLTEANVRDIQGDEWLFQRF